MTFHFRMDFVISCSLTHQHVGEDEHNGFLESWCLVVSTIFLIKCVPSSKFHILVMWFTKSKLENNTTLIVCIIKYLAYTKLVLDKHVLCCERFHVSIYGALCYQNELHGVSSISTPTSRWQSPLPHFGMALRLSHLGLRWFFLCQLFFHIIHNFFGSWSTHHFYLCL
jgi:hypothetical protein